MTVEHVTFDNVIHLLHTYKKSLTGILIGFTVVLAERSVEGFAYACPCDRDIRILYATQFMVIPAILLFVAGIAFKTKTWKLIIGCCKKRRKKDDTASTQAGPLQSGHQPSQPLQAGPSQPSQAEKQSCCSSTGWMNFYNNFAFVLIAPLVWVVLIILDGDYLACAYAKEVYLNETKEGCVPKETPYTDLYQKVSLNSQVAGWFLAGGLGVFALFLHVIVRSCSPMTYHDQKFKSQYKHIIAETIEEVQRNEMKGIVTENRSTKINLNALEKQWNTNYETFINEKTHLRKKVADNFLQIQTTGKTASAKTVKKDHDPSSEMSKDADPQTTEEIPLGVKKVTTPQQTEKDSETSFNSS